MFYLLVFFYNLHIRKKRLKWTQRNIDIETQNAKKYKYRNAKEINTLIYI